MAKASSFWWKWIAFLRGVGEASSQGNRPLRKRRGDRAPAADRPLEYWWVFFILASILGSFDLKLFVATSGGVGAMALAYWARQANWQQYRAQLRELGAGANGRIAIAAGSGIVGTIATYAAASVWASAENPWSATVSIAQGAATIAILALLVAQLARPSERDREDALEALWDRLSHPHPVRRLAAVRRLGSLIARRCLSPTRHRLAIESLQLMVPRESETIVREAILEILGGLPRDRRLQAGSETPVSLARKVDLPARERPIGRSPEKFPEKQDRRQRSPAEVFSQEAEE